MRNDMQLFVDMDGVLADFDRGYNLMIDPLRTRETDVNWKRVTAYKGFFEQLPPMPDFERLWDAVQPFNPIILTGIPCSVAEAEDNKRAWVKRHIGDHVKVIGCLSKNKKLHGKPADILIDDNEKYMHLWTEMGGYWITHRSAEESIRILMEHING